MQKTPLRNAKCMHRLQNYSPPGLSFIENLLAQVWQNPYNIRYKMGTYANLFVDAVGVR